MRRKIFYLGSLIAALILIQFIRPDKNLGGPDMEADFTQVTLMPDTLANIFVNSCYDCHSNHTRYPWYGNLAPLSWYLNGHIAEGKAHLNFSSWGTLDKAQRITNLDQICEEIRSGSMPLRSYLLIHRSSRLSEPHVRAICEWTESEALKILSEK